MIQVRFYTLGCKLNQLETESLADAFCREGFSLVPWEKPEDPGSGIEPCILLVNTCTVTSHAEQKARSIIRKALRDHPQGLVVITGCYAQMEAEVLEALEAPEVLKVLEVQNRRVFVIPGERKDGLLDLPAFLNRTLNATDSFSLNGEKFTFLRDVLAEWTSSGSGGVQGSFRFRPARFSFHSRAFVKIQDGCDKQCAFCRVNLARGKSRSRDTLELLEDIKTLEEKGFCEAVLTGVNISLYRGGEPGFDCMRGVHTQELAVRGNFKALKKGMYPETNTLPKQHTPSLQGGVVDLAGLLDFLLSNTKKIRLRLSSLESGAFVPGFMDIISHKRIRPHFHLSIQSGSPEVLARMGRPGSLELFEEGIEGLRKVKEDPFLACDIITGFPGESEFDFERTFEFCKKSDFAWIHAFPFSRRPGTAAWNFKNRVSERDARIRLGRLTELAHRGRSEYVRRCTGKEFEFVPVAAPGPSEKKSLADETFLPEKSGRRSKICGKRFLSGVTENYLKVFFPNEAGPLSESEIHRCRIIREAKTEIEKNFDAEAQL